MSLKKWPLYAAMQSVICFRLCSQYLLGWPGLSRPQFTKATMTQRAAKRACRTNIKHSNKLQRSQGYLIAAYSSHVKPLLNCCCSAVAQCNAQNRYRYINWLSPDDLLPENISISCNDFPLYAAMYTVICFRYCLQYLLGGPGLSRPQFTKATMTLGAAERACRTNIKYIKYIMVDLMQIHSHLYI